MLAEPGESSDYLQPCSCTAVFIDAFSKRFLLTLGFKQHDTDRKRHYGHDSPLWQRHVNDAVIESRCELGRQFFYELEHSLALMADACEQIA
jgi:hypothetical protein